MKLYLVKRVDDSELIDLLPTLQQARKRVKEAAEIDEPEEWEVEPIEVAPTAKAVCAFISQRFGGRIFEN